jgi:hypothetical protein
MDQNETQPGQENGHPSPGGVKSFFRRNNRVITLIAGVAICIRLFLQYKYVAVGVLIGGMLPVIYFDALQRQLRAGLAAGSASKLRGRLFTSFLLRYSLIAIGLGYCYWLSMQAFWAAVASLAIMYISMLAMLCRRAQQEHFQSACPRDNSSGDTGATGN